MKNNTYTFEEALTALKDRSWKEGAVLWHTNHANSFDEKKLEYTYKILKELGFDKFEILGNGEHAFALGDRQKGLAVRIGKGFSLPKEEEVIQPVLSFAFGGSVFSVNKLLNTKDVTEQHVLSVRNKLGSKSWNFNEARRDNVGLLDDGTPVVLDPENISFNSRYTDNMDNRRNPDARFLPYLKEHFMGEKYLKLRQQTWFVMEEISSGNNPFKDKYEWTFDKHFQGIDEKYKPSSPFIYDVSEKIEGIIAEYNKDKSKQEGISKTQDGKVPNPQVTISSLGKPKPDTEKTKSEERIR